MRAEPKPLPEPSPEGRVVTFYSYKGGTGRSMALANVAWLLAMSGRRVLIIDWDLEAPGVHRYFHPLLEDKQLLNTEGLLDFVDKIAGRAAVSPGLLDEVDVDIVEYITMLRWPANSPVTWERFGPRARIDLLLAGRQGPSYGRKLNAFNWIDFYERLNGRKLLRMARDQLTSVYDYVLIDSRTGVSDTSGICTVELPDTVVICFTLNDQSIYGACDVADSIAAHRGACTQSELGAAVVPFRILPIPMRVEMLSEKLKRETAYAVAQRKFSQFIAHMSKEEQSKYWGSMQVGYIPFYAFEEIPAVFGDPPHDDLTLTARIKEIARSIAGDSAIKGPGFADDFDAAERVRKTVLSWFLRAPVPIATDPVDLIQSVYDNLGAADQEQMKSLLLRAVYVTGTKTPGAATLRLEDLELPLQQIARKLVDEGVLRLYESEVSIADRTIVDRWVPLRGWISADQEFLEWRQSLAASARSWQMAARDDSALLRGKLLENAKAWLRDRSHDLNEVERQFIKESDRPRAAERGVVSLQLGKLRIQFSTSRLGFFAVALAGVFLAASPLSNGLAQLMRSVIERARGTPPHLAPADIMVLAKQYLAQDPLTAALLLTEIPAYPATESDRQTAMAIADMSLPIAVLHGSQAFKGLEVARDGSKVITVGDGGADLWDTIKWNKTRSLSTGAGVISASFNGWVPERAKLKGGSGNVDRAITVDAVGTVRQWSLDGRLLTTFDSRHTPPDFFDSCKNRLATKKPRLANFNLDLPFTARFSPDETAILVAYRNGPIVMLDAQTGSCFDVYTPDSAVGAAFSPDAEWIATYREPQLIFFHVQDWKRQSRYVWLPAQQRGTEILAMSVNRDVLFRVGTEGVLHYREQRPRNETAPLAQLDALADVAAFSLDDRYVATSLGALASWKAIDPAGTASPATTMQGHSADITAIAFDPGTKFVLTASKDQTVRVWPIEKASSLGKPSWQELITYLRSATHACLALEERVNLLHEDRSTAKGRFGQCTSQYQ